jgi:hypothetical protein
VGVCMNGYINITSRTSSPSIMMKKDVVTVPSLLTDSFKSFNKTVCVNVCVYLQIHSLINIHAHSFTHSLTHSLIDSFIHSYTTQPPFTFDHVRLSGRGGPQQDYMECSLVDTR